MPEKSRHEQDQVRRDAVLKALVSGKGVPIRFRSGNPHEVLYRYEEKPWGFGWLMLGIAGTALGFYAHRKLKEESA